MLVLGVGSWWRCAGRERHPVRHPLFSGDSFLVESHFLRRLFNDLRATQSVVPNRPRWEISARAYAYAQITERLT